MKTLLRCLLTVFVALCLVCCLIACVIPSLKISQGQMLLIKSLQGTAIIEFTSFGNKDGESTYRWRYKAITATQTESGEGKLFEKYEISKVVPGFHWLRDAGSQLKVKAGPIQVEWSYGCSGSYGWIYPGTNVLETKVLDDKDFESYPL